MNRIRTALLIILAAAAVGIGAGCGDEPATGRTITTTDYLGRPLTDLFGRMGYIPGAPLPDGFGIVTYEMGPPITGKPSLDGPGSAAVDWLTVAACWSDPEGQLTLGVLPMSDATPEIVATARARGYDDRVRECPGTSTTFTMPPPE